MYREDDDDDTTLIMWKIGVDPRTEPLPKIKDEQDPELNYSKLLALAAAILLISGMIMIVLAVQLSETNM